MPVIIHRMDNSDFYRILSCGPEIICMHDAAFCIHNHVKLSSNMPSLYKLFAMHNSIMLGGCVQFHDIVTVLFMVSMIVKCEHSVLYFATQGHSMMNLRNALPV